MKDMEFKAVSENGVEASLTVCGSLLDIMRREDIPREIAQGKADIEQAMRNAGAKGSIVWADA